MNLKDMQKALELELIDSLGIVTYLADLVAQSQKEKAAIIMVDKFISLLKKKAKE